MKRIKYIIVLLFGCLSTSVLAQSITMEVNEATTLEKVIQYLEEEHDFLFSYKEEDIQGIKLHLVPKRETINTFLQSILKNTDIQFEIVQGNYVILTKDESFSTIEKEQILPLLCGKIVDSLSQQALGYATIFIERSKKGTTTNDDGRFELKASFNPTDSIVISYVGYQEKRFLASDLLASPCPTISLNYLEFEEDFIVVTDYLTTGISLKNNGASTELRPNEIGTLPGQVEPDILKTIQFLPGITSPDGSASGLCVRGGNPDQNLILWEDIPLYHTAHYFGMISAINPYIIDKASVYRGGFDAEFGSRISGVIDLRSDDRKIKEPNFIVGTNLTNAFTSGRFALAEDKVKVIYSLRGSSLDVWRTPTFKNITRRINQGVLFEFPSSNKLPEGIRFKNDFAFIDSNIKTSFQLSKRDKLSASFLYGFNDFKSEIDDDQRKQTQRDDLFLKNLGASLNWQHQWNKTLSSKILLVHSDYRYDYKYDIIDQNESMNPTMPDKEGIKNSKILEQQIQVVTDWQTSKRHLLKVGYQLTFYDVAYQIEKKSRNQPQSDRNNGSKTPLHILHTSFNTAKDKRFGFNAGLRQSYFKKGKGRKLFFETRLRLWYQLSDAMNLYANTGRYFQFLSQVFQIEGDRASIETPVWVLAGQEAVGQADVPILRSDQHQLGIIFERKSWLIDVQSYYKRIGGLTSLTSGFDEELSTAQRIGNATITGVDVLIKKRWPHFRTWFSYTISKTDYHFVNFFDSDFASPNDQRHVFHWVNLWKRGQWQASLGWKIASGRPFSEKDFYEVFEQNTMGANIEVIRPLKNIVDTEPNIFNSRRLSSHHQLDASIAYSIIPKNEKYGKGLIGFSLFNAYNQTNLYEKSFLIDVNGNEASELRYSNKIDMGITPNLSLKWEW